MYGRGNLGQFRIRGPWAGDCSVFIEDMGSVIDEMAQQNSPHHVKLRKQNQAKIMLSRSVVHSITRESACPAGFYQIFDIRIA